MKYYNCLLCKHNVLVMPYWIIGLDKWIPPIEKQSPASSHEGLVLISIVMVCWLYMVKRSLLHIYSVENDARYHSKVTRGYIANNFKSKGFFFHSMTSTFVI